MNPWLQLLGGGVLLFVGAEWFVGGASALALALRVPQILVGLTVVAYGTSAPEVIVGIEAARAGHGEVALGNVIGSNIANIGLILGCATLLRPASVDGTLRGRELPVLLASTALLPLLLMDGLVSRYESVCLLAAALLYTAWAVLAARSRIDVRTAHRDTETTLAASDAAGVPRPMSRLHASAIAVLGLVVLLVGGNQFVNGAVVLAHAFGMSERLVGLTVVALGTSLPELVTSLVAAKRGHSDLAVGNVVGSNIFNVFLCLGSAGLAGTIESSLRAVALDLGTLGAMTACAALFIRTERTISRLEGGTVLALYAGFVALTLAGG